MPWASQQSLVCCQPHLALAEVCSAVRAAVRRVGRLVGAHAQHAILPHTRVGVHLISVSVAWTYTQCSQPLQEFLQAEWQNVLSIGTLDEIGKRTDCLRRAL